LAQADHEFLSSLEENTNFITTGTLERNKMKQREAPTILSRVRRFGAAGHDQRRYVVTSDGVTDDPSRYLPKRSDWNHSYLDPAASKAKTRSPPKKKRSSRKFKFT